MFYKEAVCVEACPSMESPNVKCPPDDESQSRCNIRTNYGLVYKGGSLLGVCLPDYNKLPPDAKQNWDIVMYGFKINPINQQL